MILILVNFQDSQKRFCTQEGKKGRPVYFIIQSFIYKLLKIQIQVLKDSRAWNKRQVHCSRWLLFADSPPGRHPLEELWDFSSGSLVTVRKQHTQRVVGSSPWMAASIWVVELKRTVCLPSFHLWVLLSKAHITNKMTCLLASQPYKMCNINFDVL